MEHGWQGHEMTTVQITLPDQLALEAERAGLFLAMDRMSAIDEPATMSPEAVAEEISAMRAMRTLNRVMKNWENRMATDKPLMA